MTKRITAVFLVFALLLLSGCGKRLTAEEYRDELKSCWSVYLSAQTDIVKDIMSLEDGGTISDEFDKKCKTFEKAMKSFDKINPPADMNNKHKQLVKSLNNEREWLSAVRAYTSAKTSAERDQADQRIQAAASYQPSFPQLYGEILKELPREADFYDEQHLNDVISKWNDILGIG